MRPSLVKGIHKLRKIQDQCRQPNLDIKQEKFLEANHKCHAVYLLLERERIQKHYFALITPSIGKQNHYQKKGEKGTALTGFFIVAVYLVDDKCRYQC